MERFATFIGPLTWGAIITFGSKTNSTINYKFALMAMALFVLVGLILTKKIPDLKNKTNL